MHLTIFLLLLFTCSVLSIQQIIPSIVWEYSTPKLDVGLTQEEKEFMLKIHNTYRKYVAMGKFDGKPPAADMQIMGWCESCAKDAQAWAENCTGPPHGNDKDQGQNSALFGSPEDMIKEAFLMWADEESEKWKTTTMKDFWPDFAHFSQIIWASTYKVGCGYSSCKGKGSRARLICNYYPAGNGVGLAPYLIGKPCSGCYPPERSTCVDEVLCKVDISDCSDKDGYSELCYQYFKQYPAADQGNPCITLAEFAKITCRKTCNYC